MTELTEPTDARLVDLDPPPADEPANATAQVRPVRTRRAWPNPIGAVRRDLNGIAAVGVKELRGRMRGRRAFVILTLYLVFLAGFAWAWQLIAERAYSNSTNLFPGSATFASAAIGQEIFGALIVVETLLVVFLAPAFTAGAISLEREKQTLDMLTATPISSLAIVVGKLLSALTYVFVLIGASIPLTAIVFVFGGVGPDEVLRGYVVLVVSAIGLGSVGLFISAVMQRTQAATVVTFFGVLALTLGTLFLVLFWMTMAGIGRGGAITSDGIGPIKGRPPAALLWFNPFAAEYDVICGASDGNGGWCDRLSLVTNGAISVGIGGGASTTTIFPSGGGSSEGVAPPPVVVDPGVPVPPDAPVDLPADGPDEAKARELVEAAANPRPDPANPRLNAVQVVEPQPFGLRRDVFWPQSVAAWLVVSLLSILGSIQLVSPTRRWRLARPGASRRTT